MLYDYQGDLLNKYPSLVGDGVADDTTALQAIVNSGMSVKLPADLTIKISSTIVIDPSICAMFDGGNSTIVISGDITAFQVLGSLTASMTANPNTLPAKIVDKEGGFTFCNCKIQGEENGTAIELNGAFKTTVRNCYLHHLKTGIEIKNQCRDIEITGNQIYGVQLYGIHIDSTVNLHQININDNIISYAIYCIYFDKPKYIANVQIAGNDIEISSYPTTNIGISRCIMVDCDTDDTTLTTSIYEIEITGNTIQGHNQSDAIIQFTGGVNKTRVISDVNITGNHISNSNDALIKLDCVSNINICGNTVKTCTNYAIVLGESCMIINIVGNTQASGGGFVNSEYAVRRINISNNTSVTSKTSPYNIISASLENAVINGNVLGGSNTSIVVNPTILSKCIVANNVVGSGTYTIKEGVSEINNI